MSVPTEKKKKAQRHELTLDALKKAVIGGSLTALFSQLDHDLTSETTIKAMVFAAKDDLCIGLSLIDKTELASEINQEAVFAKVKNRVHLLRSKFKKAAEGYACVCGFVEEKIVPSLILQTPRSGNHDLILVY